MSTNSFNFFSAIKVSAPGQPATLYIEGDGRAWITRSQQSTDPTPISTLVRDKAMADPHANVIYMARACQFIGTFDAPCDQDYWGIKRFAPEIIQSTNQALTQMKQLYQVNGFHLIGYSGGGAIAALIAAQRNDILSLTTFAGNLDTDMHSAIHGVTPLDGSLNPKTIAAQISSLPQTHYAGAKDENVTPEIIKSFIEAMPQNNAATFILVPEATHQQGWESVVLQ